MSAKTKTKLPVVMGSIGNPVTPVAAVKAMPAVNATGNQRVAATMRTLHHS